MRVHCLTQQRADVPADDRWLTASERAVLVSLRAAKRRDDWRLGRWTAKRALAARFGADDDPRTMRHLEIHATDSGAPEAYIDGEPAPVTLSISHSVGSAFCALAPRGLALGCDVERVAPRADAFVADYFTENERALVGVAGSDVRDTLVTLIWSAKESALKALRQGLRLNTCAVEVTLGAAEVSPSWQRIVVQYEAGATCFHGWWRCEDSLVYSIVTDSRAATLEVLRHGSAGLCTRKSP